jgi:hypothetical protein
MRIARTALSSFLLLLALVATPLAAAPQDDAVVTIVPSDGGRATSLTLAAVAADVGDRTYTLRAADGSTSTVAVRAGVSVAALLAAADLKLTESIYAEIMRPDGSPSALLVADDLTGAGERLPVVWSDHQGLHFLRPSDGEGDVNAGDLVTVSEGTLTIELRTGEPVKPRIEVSKLHARLGEPLRFRASLAVGAVRPGMGFTWYFDDGGGYVSGTDVTHRYRRTGLFRVLLHAVRGGSEILGVPTHVVVRIVAARRPRDQGAARRSDEGGAGTGSAVTGGAGGTGSGGSTTGSGSGTTTGGVTAPPAPSIPAPPPQTPSQPSAAPPAQPRGELVSGTLLAAVGGSPAAFAGAAGPSAAARTAERDAPLDVPVGAWVAIGLAALLALGWGLESRHTLPFWQP